MSSKITIGSRVEANRDLPVKQIKKGDKGKVINVKLIDSEIYLDIDMDNKQYVKTSCDNCWNLIT